MTDRTNRTDDFDDQPTTGRTDNTGTTQKGGISSTKDDMGRDTNYTPTDDELDEV